MFTYQTEKKLKYYDQVIEIYKQTGYSAYRIAKLNLVPLDKHTIAAWIANFVVENGTLTPHTVMQSNQEPNNEELQALKKKVAELEKQLKYVHSYDIDPHSYDVDPLEEGRAFKEQSLFACKQAAA